MIANVQGNARSKIWTPLSFYNFTDPRSITSFFLKLELFNICEDPFESDDISEEQIDKVNQLKSKINKELNLDYLDVRNDLDRYFDPLYN